MTIIAKLKGQISTLENDIKDLKKTIQRLEEKVEGLDLDIKNDQILIRFSEDMNKIKKLENLVKRNQERIEKIEEKIEARGKEIKEKEEKIEKIENKINELENDLNLKKFNSLSINKTISISYISTAKDSETSKVLKKYNLKHIHGCALKDLLPDYNEIDLNKKAIPNFVWPLLINKNGNYGEQMNELKTTPHMVAYIKEHVNLQGYHIHDVATERSLKLTIPINEYSSYVGSPDAIIVTKEVGLDSLAFTLRVIFEFKTPNSISLKSNQRKLETIAATIASNYPVLVVVTDFKTFHLILCRDSTLYEATLNDHEKALAFISYWLREKCFDEKFGNDYFQKIESLNLVDFQKSLKSCSKIAESILKSQNKMIQELFFRDNVPKVKTDYDSEQFQQYLEEIKQQSFPLDIFQIEEAFFVKHSILCSNSRSGEVYKIQIGSNFYALKLYCLNQLRDDILEEMENEFHIYKHLKSKGGESIHWPELQYAGYLFNDSYYAICTNLIERKSYANILQAFTHEMFNACYKAIKELHKLDVVHRDLRLANIIIKEDETAVIVDFGFSQIEYDFLKKQDEYCDFKSKHYKLCSSYPLRSIKE